MAIGSETQDEEKGEEQFHRDYVTEEVLGKGMSSVVRRCVHRASGKSLAVKIIDLDEERLSGKEIARLRQDAHSEVRLQRAAAGETAIVQLRDFYQSPASLHIVFDLAPGGELFDYLSRKGTLTERRTRWIMRQLLGALKGLHRANIVHRDVKPENILMVDEERIALTDFGFAHQLRPGEKLTELVGTPGYLAPEVLRASMYEDSRGYGVEVDVWAAGVVMYTLLAGYAPFFHRRQIYMLRAISEGRYQFRSPEWDSISTAAKDVIRGMLKVEVSERLSAAEALEMPFFKGEAFADEPIKFNARRRFKAAIVQVRSLIRLLRVAKVAELVAWSDVQRRPYSHRPLRKTLDTMAFRIYGHWVKKDGDQHREALFANRHPLQIREKRKRKIPAPTHPTQSRPLFTAQ